ncbi:nuclease domain protein [Brucella grignonensis]|uniref:Nuclease domain protein n=2 Tax=Brucella grignonensis TaxID=94627 RepID=A0A256FS31_9HYPH|nr:nuclease domain protein [Brucella grignonensis]
MFVLAVPAQEHPPPGYREIEARAKAAGAGIWSSVFKMPSEWRRTHGTYNPLAPQR